MKTGWILAGAVDGAAVVIGHRLAKLETRMQGQIRSQRLNEPPRKPLSLVTPCRQRTGGKARTAIQTAGMLQRIWQ